MIKTGEEDGLVLEPLTLPEVEPGGGYEVRAGVLSVLVHDPGIQPPRPLSQDPGDLAGPGEDAGREEPSRI